MMPGSCDETAAVVTVTPWRLSPTKHSTEDGLEVHVCAQLGAEVTVVSAEVAAVNAEI